MIYVMSDIHGDFQSFCRMLVKIGFSDNDTLYILGDAVDKGDSSFRLLSEIRKTGSMVLLKGNHEYLFERYLQGTITAEFWDACGGNATRREADVLAPVERAEILDYLKSLPVYETVAAGGEYFLTHSGFHADFRVDCPETGLTDIRSSVEQAVNADQERYLFSNDIHFIPSSIRFDRKVIVGHYPVIFLPEHEKAEIYHGSKYIDIDTGNERRNEGGRLSCLRLDDGEEFYV